MFITETQPVRQPNNFTNESIAENEMLIVVSGIIFNRLLLYDVLKSDLLHKKASLLSLVENHNRAEFLDNPEYTWKFL